MPPAPPDFHSALSLSLLSPEDAGEAAEVESVSAQAPWSRSQILRDVENPLARYWIVRYNKAPIAFAGFWRVLDEAQLLNIAVTPSFRGRGVGRRLLRAVCEDGAELGLRRILLEVREGNTAARRLYESEGFVTTHRRPRFYEDTEAALLMEKKLTP